MSKDFSDIIGTIANFAAILTAIIAVIFYYRIKRRNYYLTGIVGDYKIFSSLRYDDKSTALFQIAITAVSPKGWFFGVLKYSEIFKEAGSASGGEANVFGKIRYSYFRLFIKILLRIIIEKI